MTGSLDIEREVVAPQRVATPRDLARLQADEWVHPVVLHVCCRGLEGAGRTRYLQAHLPGAVCVELDRELGTLPMPSVPQLQQAARRWGIRPGSAVVTYDEVGGALADRLSRLLRSAGLPDVRVLLGGSAAWQGAGGRLVAGEVVPPPGDVHLGAV